MPDDDGHARPCSCCVKLMQFRPAHRETARRRDPPDANVCTGCKPGYSWVLRDPINAQSVALVPECKQRGCPGVPAVEKLGDLAR